MQKPYKMCLKAGWCGLQTAVLKTSNWSLVENDECLIPAREVWTALFDLMIIKIFSTTTQEWKKINACQEVEINLYLRLTTKDCK